MSTENQPVVILSVYTTYAWIQPTGTGGSVIYADGITEEFADARYLIKTTADEAIAEETFSAGIITDVITQSSFSSNVDLYTEYFRTGFINIGNGGNSQPTGHVNINNGTDNKSDTNIHNGGLSGVEGAVSAGSVNIMNEADQTGIINMGEDLVTVNMLGTINIETATGRTNLIKIGTGGNAQPTGHVNINNGVDNNSNTNIHNGGVSGVEGAVSAGSVNIMTNSDQTGIVNIGGQYSVTNIHVGEDTHGILNIMTGASVLGAINIFTDDINYGLLTIGAGSGTVVDITATTDFHGDFTLGQGAFTHTQGAINLNIDSALDAQNITIGNNNYAITKLDSKTVSIGTSSISTRLGIVNIGATYTTSNIKGTVFINGASETTNNTIGNAANTTNIKGIVLINSAAQTTNNTIGNAANTTNIYSGTTNINTQTPINTTREINIGGISGVSGIYYTKTNLDGHTTIKYPLILNYPDYPIAGQLGQLITVGFASGATIATTTFNYGEIQITAGTWHINALFQTINLSSGGYPASNQNLTVELWRQDTIGGTPILLRTTYHYVPVEAYYTANVTMDFAHNADTRIKVYAYTSVASATLKVWTFGEITALRTG